LKVLLRPAIWQGGFSSLLSRISREEAFMDKNRPAALSPTREDEAVRIFPSFNSDGTLA
jgi:hypothetical protein